MLVKNNSQKIIGFGKEALLPDKSLEIADSYENNAVFKTFVKNGDIEVIKTETPKVTDNNTHDNGASGNSDNGASGNSDNGSTNPPANKPTAEEIKACSKKEDYIKLAEKYGIDVNDSMLIKDIKKALGA